MKMWETMPVADAVEFVPHCRAAKLWDKEFARLELAVNKNEARAAVRDALIQVGAVKFMGKAPPEALEEQLQKTLEVLNQGS